jgi:UDP-2-acetamido-3-amino-2,3-dideoxy-glucuronate N-acetyltransferase
MWQLRLCGRLPVIQWRLPHYWAHITGGTVKAENLGSVNPTEELPGYRMDADLGVRGVKLYEVPYFADFRGSLSFAEYPGLLPFLPRRYFLTYNVPNREVRGEHAHRRCHQFLVCVAGNCSVIVDDGHHRAEMVLDRPTAGIHIHPMVWSVEYKHSPKAVLMVLASDTYDPEDYIRNYDLFLQELLKPPG